MGFGLNKKSFNKNNFKDVKIREMMLDSNSRSISQEIGKYT